MPQQLIINRIILMNKGLLLFVVFCLSFRLYAQAPYRLSWKTDGILLGGAAVLLAADVVLDAKTSPLSETEISNLDVNDINAFDVKATDNFSDAAANRSNIGLYSAAAISSGSSVVLPFLSKRSEYINEAGTLCLIWFETNAYVYLTTGIVKSTVQRIRPYAYNSEVALEYKQTSDARKSFFSAHTAVSAANAYYFAKVFSDYYPESKWRPVIWGMSALVPAWVGMERYKAGEHFPSDIIVGYAWGALCGVTVPHLHKVKDDTQTTSMKLYPYAESGGNGLSLVLRF